MLRDEINPKEFLARLNQVEMGWGACAVRDSLRTFLQADLQHLAPLAMEVAIEGQGALASILSELITAHPHKDLALTLERLLPEKTVALRGFATLVSRQVNQFLIRPKAYAASNALEMQNTAEYAKSLNNLAIRLSDDGHDEEALPLLEEAVRLYRTLTDLRPGDYLVRKASAINSLAVLQGKVGQWPNAYESSSEAVFIYERLQEAGKESAKLGLATSLKTLSDALAEFGQPEKALECACKSVQLFQLLTDMGNAENKPGLASALNSLSHRQAEAQMLSEAIASAELSVRLFQELVAASEDTFLSDLASALSSLASHLVRARRHGEAREHQRIAQEIQARFAAQNSTSG